MSDARLPLGVILAEVRDMGPTTVAEISSSTGIPESTVRRHLATLEETGYAESDRYQRRARVWLATERERNA